MFDDLIKLCGADWWNQNVFFVSWTKHWKGIYLHFIPRYTIRLYLWGFDARVKHQYKRISVPLVRQIYPEL